MGNRLLLAVLLMLAACSSEEEAGRPSQAHPGSSARPPLLSFGEAPEAVPASECGTLSHVATLGSRPFSTPDGLTSLAFSPDGKWLAAAGMGQVTVWDARTGQRYRHIPAYDPVSLAFSPCGPRIATGGHRGAVTLWDLSEGGGSLVLGSHKGMARALDFSSNGKWVVSGGQDGLVRIWDVESGTEVTRFEPHEGGVLAAMFSPDSSLLATGGQEIHVRDTATWRVVRTIPAGAGNLAFGPRGKFIAAAIRRRICVWEVDTGKKLVTLEGHDQGIWALAVSPDGSESYPAGWTTPSGSGTAQPGLNSTA